jgi:hypothetical protein
MTNQIVDQPIPTATQLIRATVFALLAAAAILVVSVLPAEYGIDPTGLGERLGLVALNENEAEPDILPADAATMSAVSSGPAVSKTVGTFRAEEQSIVLRPFEGIELKADMNAGHAFVFTWNTEDGRDVYVDMHGEMRGAADNEFVSYWKEQEQSEGQGTFTAQFEGTHGWYWQNMGEQDITVNVKISGFYNKLYQP